MSRPEVVRATNDLRARVSSWRRAGERVGLVPTMGALHAGHLALVAAAQRSADRVVASIFVNPTQFAPHEDLATYPRTFEADLDALGRAGVDLVFAPDVEEMYPEGATTVVTVGGPSEGLESDARPHFFAGVATVVTKLLIQASPDVAAFGEKDFQQLAVVRRLVQDLRLPVEIVPVPTLRDPDGLAMSSRNAYLSPDDRARAPSLFAALSKAGGRIGAGETPAAALADARAAITAAGFELDYLEFRDSGTLQSIDRLGDGPARLLVAARISRVRLIDNVHVIRR